MHSAALFSLIIGVSIFKLSLRRINERFSNLALEITVERLSIEVTMWTTTRGECCKRGKHCYFYHGNGRP